MLQPREVRVEGFAGILNTRDPMRLGVRDLVRGVNVDLDDTGRVLQRPGRTQILAGAVHSVWADGDICLFVQAGALKRLDADLATAHELATGLSEAPMAYVPLNGRVYHSNGEVTGVLDGGSVRSWGLAVPALPAITPTIGTMTAGTYLYTMTTLRADGQESGAPMAGVVDLSEGAGLTFTWGTVAGPYVAIYLTAPNGERLRLAAEMAASVGSYTWSGGLLGRQLATSLLDPPPPGQCLGEHNGRVYVGSGVDIYPTLALGPELCDLRDYLAIDGTTVNFIAGVTAGIFVGTDSQVAFLPGGRLEEFSLRTAIAARAVPGSLVFAETGKVFGGKGTDRVALFTTAAGICAGMPDGSVVNLSKERYNFTPPARVAAALRADDALAQYLVTA